MILRVWSSRVPYALLIGVLFVSLFLPAIHWHPGDDQGDCAVCLMARHFLCLIMAIGFVGPLAQSSVRVWLADTAWRSDFVAGLATPRAPPL